MKNHGIISAAMLTWITIGVFFSCSGFFGCCLIQLLTGNTLKGQRDLDPELVSMLSLASNLSWLVAPGTLVSCCALLAPKRWRGDHRTLQLATAGLLIGAVGVIWRWQIGAAILTSTRLKSG